MLRYLECLSSLKKILEQRGWDYFEHPAINCTSPSPNPIRFLCYPSPKLGIDTRNRKQDTKNSKYRNRRKSIFKHFTNKVIIESIYASLLFKSLSLIRIDVASGNTSSQSWKKPRDWAIRRVSCHEETHYKQVEENVFWWGEFLFFRLLITNEKNRRL